MAFSELATPQATRAILREFGHDPKHKLGQNFLVDDNVVGRILDLAGLEQGRSGDLPSVLEIGPGIGTLTVALLKAAHVVSVERDADLAPVLAHTTALDSDRFALLQGDALKLGHGQVEDAAASLNAPLPSMLVANLPYQIAATVILDWFERFHFIDSMTVMVQSEVADRISAHMGTKDYGAYSIKLRMHAQATGRFQVSPSCFMPAPRVESAVVRLERCDAGEDPEVVRAACRVADAAFAQRRKNIRNSMRSAFDKETVDTLLSTAGIDPTSRGEALSVEQYLCMGRVLAGES